MSKYGQSEKKAQYAMVFMVQGLARKWKQTLAYFFYNSSINSSTLQQMIMDCVKKIKSCGLYPKVVICDQDASNRSVFNKWSITPDSPCITVNDEKLFFYV